MNERIRKLIEQATKVVEPNDADYRYESFDKEKFAELIVRECSQYIEYQFDLSGDEFIVAEKLLNHFGVE